MYHPQVGDPLEALDTPVMLVDLDLMENNIASLMARFRERSVHALLGCPALFSWARLLALSGGN